MCGITGIVLKEADREGPRIVKAMASRLAHRGPDGQGWLGWNDSKIRQGQDWDSIPPSRVVLGHRRLAILDLSDGGNQPMSLLEGDLHLVFNGEIYNFLELRMELQALGHKFQTASDTEVMLHALQAWGDAALLRFIGMFALALLDLPNRRVLLARDPLGIKPLYWARSAQGLIFASEIPALLASQTLSRQVNPARIQAYLEGEATDDGSQTFFEAINQLPPAHLLEIPLDEPTAPLQPRRYWSATPMDLHGMDRTEAARELGERFIHSVKVHLRSDVPVGAALSGGIDSSAIVAAMRHLAPQAELHAFGYRPQEQALDEGAFMKAVAGPNRIILHEIREPQAQWTHLEQVIRQQGEPFGSTSILAQHLVFAAARQSGIKVMLDGQGADELFGGYPRFTGARLAELVQQGQLLSAFHLYHQVKGRPGMQRVGRSMAKVLGEVYLSPSFRISLSNFTSKASGLNLEWLQRQRLRPDPTSYSEINPGILKRQLLADLERTSLPRLLRFEDRNSMAHGVESRVPFLTTDLVNFSLGLKEEWIIDDAGTTKSLFRQAMRGKVPDFILDRQDKVGFATPEKAWLQGQREWVLESISPSMLEEIPALNVPAIRAATFAILDGQRPFDFRLWRWVNLARWARETRAEFRF